MRTKQDFRPSSLHLSPHECLCTAGSSQVHSCCYSRPNDEDFHKPTGSSPQHVNWTTSVITLFDSDLDLSCQRRSCAHYFDFPRRNSHSRGFQRRQFKTSIATAFKDRIRGVYAATFLLAVLAVVSPWSTVSADTHRAPLPLTPCSNRTSDRSESLGQIGPFTEHAANNRIGLSTLKRWFSSERLLTTTENSTLVQPGLNTTNSTLGNSTNTGNSTNSTFAPTVAPVVSSSTDSPTRQPTSIPTTAPTRIPTSQLTSVPTAMATGNPTLAPASVPTIVPTTTATDPPTMGSTGKPTAGSTSQPTALPTIQQTGAPTTITTTTPTSISSSLSTTESPSGNPTKAPSQTTSPPPTMPVQNPLALVPTDPPTAGPTNSPSKQPTTSPTGSPTLLIETAIPTINPTTFPTKRPTDVPSSIPTRAPTMMPTIQTTNAPTTSPSGMPTQKPSSAPTPPTATASPSLAPVTGTPTVTPSTEAPSSQPTSLSPTTSPSTLTPSTAPVTMSPTLGPSFGPTLRPTRRPRTRMPTSQPSGEPTHSPTNRPTTRPTSRPTRRPTGVPTSSPTIRPTVTPGNPTFQPTTAFPTEVPTLSPTAGPTTVPTMVPTAAPSSQTPTLAIIAGDNFYQNDIAVLEVFGARFVVKQFRRRLNEDSPILSDCVVFWKEYIEDAIRKGVLEVTPGIEMADVELHNVAMDRLLDTDELVLFFDVAISLRSPTTNFSARQYIEGQFDSVEETQALLDYLRTTDCPEFAYVSSAELILPAEQPVAATSAPAGSSGANTGLIVGIVAAVIAAAMLFALFVFVKLKGRRNARQTENVPFVIGDDAGTNEYASEIGLRTAGDVSTLSDPIPIGFSAVTGDASTIGSFSLDYDFQKAYQPSLSEMSGSHADTMSNLMLSTDDDTLEAQYVMNEQFEVIAPAGMLGLILETNEDGVPVVNSIKSSSVLFGQIQVGDRLLSVDGQDVTVLLASDVSKLIASKKHKPERRLVFARSTKGR